MEGEEEEGEEKNECGKEKRQEPTGSDDADAE